MAAIETADARAVMMAVMVMIMMMICVCVCALCRNCNLRPLARIQSFKKQPLKQCIKHTNALFEKSESGRARLFNFNKRVAAVLGCLTSALAAMRANKQVAAPNWLQRAASELRAPVGFARAISGERRRRRPARRANKARLEKRELANCRETQASKRVLSTS